MRAMQFLPGISFAVTTTNSFQLNPGWKEMFLMTPRVGSGCGRDRIVTAFFARDRFADDVLVSHVLYCYSGISLLGGKLAVAEHAVKWFSDGKFPAEPNGREIPNSNTKHD